MDTVIKPILRYAEEEITNTWPTFIQDSLEHIYGKIQEIDCEDLLTGELSYLIENIYREGFKDGLALCYWLENGSYQV